MDGVARESRLVSTFVTLADTLVLGFDVVDLLQTLIDSCAELLHAEEAGIMLADERGELSVVASTSESAVFIDTMQQPGPALDSYAAGVALSVPDVRHADEPFATAARAQGFLSVHCFPLRLRADVIGALSLFRSSVGPINDEDASVAQGLADVATIGILQERALREQSDARAQLQGALDSRIVIEQAKGVVAQLKGWDMDQAFQALRDYARSNNVLLREVAELVVARRLTF
jgi:transcriptional regulator with GAF, ATPase, and Fis domain